MGALSPHPAFSGLGGKTPEELFSRLPTPCYIVDEKRLLENGAILASLAKETGCSVLLAQKAFSCYDFYPLLSRFLCGTEASGLYEARLGSEEMAGKEIHVFSAAYREEEFGELLSYVDHIVFNSPSQLRKFGFRAKAANKSVGLRINPECSTQSRRAIYDPCAAGSRLGTTRAVWEREMTKELTGLLDGLHFHTLCEQDADALELTLRAVEQKFGDVLPKMRWLNMGGGHHITRPAYDLSRLKRLLLDWKRRFGLEIYLEPGEACALNAGYLACRVLDVVENGDTRIAIVDASAACHMPDVLEMPYTPPLFGASEGGAHVCRLAGPTCLSGDVIGDYGFDRALKEGDLLLFGDMAIYSVCKNNTFNGIPLPNVWKRTESGELIRLTDFRYSDFKSRLGSRIKA